MRRWMDRIERMGGWMGQCKQYNSAIVVECEQQEWMKNIE
jgi:hypothetical protein